MFCQIKVPTDTEVSIIAFGMHADVCMNVRVPERFWMGSLLRSDFQWSEGLVWVYLPTNQPIISSQTTLTKRDTLAQSSQTFGK